MSKSTKSKDKTSKSASNTAQDIDRNYWHYLLTEGRRPTSVYAFAQACGADEAEFYQHAASFDALEAGYWRRLVDETVAILQEDADYPDYPAEQKLLAFYYTFFAHVQGTRSRLVGFFPRPGCIKRLKPMRDRYLEFVSPLIREGVEDGSIADRKKLTEKYPQLLFEQFRGIIEFHRHDQSEGFQDTDALIEKSVRLSADLARTGTIDSAFDLGRFLIRRIILPQD